MMGLLSVVTGTVAPTHSDWTQRTMQTSRTRFRTISSWRNSRDSSSRKLNVEEPVSKTPTPTTKLALRTPNRKKSRRPSSSIRCSRWSAETPHKIFLPRKSKKDLITTSVTYLQYQTWRTTHQACRGYSVGQETTIRTTALSSMIIGSTRACFLTWIATPIEEKVSIEWKFDQSIFRAWGWTRP